MLFNSLEFIFAFLPITLLIYYVFISKNLIYASKFWLVGASLFFYAWWNIFYLPLLVFSILLNYYLSRFLVRGNKNGLILGIVFNLSLLGYFKYANFFIDNVNKLGFNIIAPEIILPLAISFFTFQQIAYLVDRYRGLAQHNSFLDYALFITFFPQLIAGPIVHHKEMMPQFSSAKNLLINNRNIALGIFIFITGLFKKIVIADSFAVWANEGFSAKEQLSLIDAWSTSLSYTFQLYFDFSGYTDMAIGLALLFNIKLPINFNSPYKALDIQDFWRRWHITLSRFLRDYLYIPLGGNRRGTLRVYLNLFLTFLLGGLWHGASWMFVIWGALHGSALILHKLWKTLNFKMHPLLAWIVTFNFINFSWIFFRAEDLDSAFRVIHGMIGNYNFSQPGVSIIKEASTFIENYPAKLAIILMLVVTVVCENSGKLISTKKISFSQAIWVASLFSIIFILSITSSLSKSEFLYFNF